MAQPKHADRHSHYSVGIPKHLRVAYKHRSPSSSPTLDATSRQGSLKSETNAFRDTSAIDFRPSSNIKAVSYLEDKSLLSPLSFASHYHLASSCNLSPRFLRYQRSEPDNRSFIYWIKPSEVRLILRTFGLAIFLAFSRVGEDADIPVRAMPPRRSLPVAAAIAPVETLTAPPPLSPLIQRLRTDWRWAGISQFVWTFSDAFGLLDWDIEVSSLAFKFLRIRSADTNIRL